jgi:hypothetical protein
VIPLFSGTVTSAARTTGHVISFWITLAMMAGICAYIAYTSKRRWGSCWKKYGPLYLCIIASILVMMDQSRHYFQDLGWWPAPGSSEYRDYCNAEDMSCLSVVGWIFTVFATYLGFVFLFVGTLWNANICQKLKDIKRKWRELRAGNENEA